MSFYNISGKRVYLERAAKALLAMGLALGCGDYTNVFGDTAGVGGADGGGHVGGQGGDERPPAHASRIDLLLTIDNSRSMADKQEILSHAVPRLIDLFLNPRCVDAAGVFAAQPATPEASCPGGTRREFSPVRDIHVGVVTTSLGGHGADSCSSGPTENDRGRLIDRAPGGGTVASYKNLGFLAWDPMQTKDPPGESDAAALTNSLIDLVMGAGQLGCGFEATLESWYRFLIEPDPYSHIELVGLNAQPVGTDEILLAQRRAFLRPDSLLIVTLLSDENDCSIRDGGQYFLVGQVYVPGSTQQYRLPRARAACASDPNDPCCRSCGQPPGPGCSTAADQCDVPLTVMEDALNLRCWDQKRRFGVDFLQPIERYVRGLSDTLVADRHGNVVTNPLFQDLDPSDAISSVRDERLVYLATLVGVPWQDLARRSASGAPNLVMGLDAKGNPRGGFQSAAELVANGTWQLVIGEPSQYHSKAGTLPTDPLMRESIDPRSGVHPITMEFLAPPGSATNANSINGHEYTIPARDNLQYACIFPLLEPRDCSLPGMADQCDCVVPGDDPLCQDPAGKFTTIQYRAKAYPGIRQLWLAREQGDRAVVGSICPVQIDNPSAADFGYQPLVASLVEAVAHLLVDEGS